RSTPSKAALPDGPAALPLYAPSRAATTRSCRSLASGHGQRSSTCDGLHAMTPLGSQPVAQLSSGLPDLLPPAIGRPRSVSLDSSLMDSRTSFSFLIDFIGTPFPAWG